MRRLRILAAAVFLAAAPARAFAPGTATPAPQPEQSAPSDTPSDVGVRGTAELTAAFGRICLDHPDDAEGLRAVLTREKWDRMDGLDSPKILQGKPGFVYEHDVSDIHVVLGTPDSGGCTIVANRGDRDALWQGLEDAMGARGFKFVLAADHDGRQYPTLHIRRYHLAMHGALWDLTVATDPTAANHVLIGLLPLADNDRVPADSQLSP